ncbi:immunity 53 family protein [Paenibacillus sp. CGMCC 1.16610]|uniref:Rhodanese-related sulfurtransferase n=1 Tax=Paenibacillus anseongense TaxID=2682845 RepID=A0ABW9UIG1_9BACL|nr:MULTISPECIES: immunity 53 family protein [Paenibacillus]MBA2941972.1 immunity 53 family protein [Paenibacillus sp. CGMCC 1.16610]MVQ38488.1 rhodanese-related sulfurtransferase [Paenibacillus anseongense]
MNLIEWLEDWYLSQCDGDWEHCYGLKIETLDNPGWSVKINLQETTLENKSFESLVNERTEHDWIHCRLKEGYFEGFGGPKNLGEILLIFKDWVELN